MGPTGTGKSALSIAIAQARPTVIINADAMQMVDALRVLSARPTEAEEAMAEHALYGVLPASSPTSVATWLAHVEPAIRRAWAEGKLPLLVGGTGMYIKALRDGLAEVPPIPEEIRQRIRSYAEPSSESRVASHGEPAGQGSAPAGRVGGELGAQRREAQPTPPSSITSCIYARLQHIDPIMAAQLKPGDTQRILRALEVMEATGQSLDHWQKQATRPIIPEAKFTHVYVTLPREEVYRRIDKRFEIMLKNGALEEVRHLMAQAPALLPPDYPIHHSPSTMHHHLPPIFRAHGVPELAAHLRGEMTLADATTRGQQNTRNYAKRQMTWLRNQLPEAVAVAPDVDPATVLGLLES